MAQLGQHLLLLQEHLGSISGTYIKAVHKCL